MKNWKLVSGILSCVFFIIITFQSCAAGIANTLEDNGDVSGTAGFLVALLMLSSGIVSIATRNAKSNGGNTAIIVLCVIAALVGYTNYGIFKDLVIWSTWCVILAVVAVIDRSKRKKVKKDEHDDVEINSDVDNDNISEDNLEK